MDAGGGACSAQCFGSRLMSLRMPVMRLPMLDRPLTLIATGLLVVAGLFASPAAATNPQGQPVHIATTYQLQSDLLGDSRQINVWLPPGYAQNEDRHSVVYLLDGALDQDFHHIAGLAQLGSLSWTYGPVIVVGVQTRNRQRELTPPPVDPRYRHAFPASGGARRFRAFLAEEVVPFVERTFRTGARRAVMGESLAGLFVVDTLLAQPELFHDYVAISPSLWWDDRRPMREAAARLQAHRPLAGRRLYLAIADEGGTMQEGVDLLRAAIEHLPGDAISLMYSDRSDIASHHTIYHGAAEQALRWLYPVPPHETGSLPWYMIDGAHPPTFENGP